MKAQTKQQNHLRVIFPQDNKAFTVPILQATTNQGGDVIGHICDMSSGATEWFPLSSKLCVSHLVGVGEE